MWRALEGLLRYLEEIAALWACREVGLGPMHVIETRRVAHLPSAERLALEVTGEAEDELRRCWGSWYGRQEEFYSCADRVVNDLTWHDLEVMGGIELEARRSATVQAMQRLRDPSEAFGEAGASVHASVAGNGVVVWGYSRYDGVALPASVLDAIAAVAESSFGATGRARLGAIGKRRDLNP